jgi:hypothetical protein
MNQTDPSSFILHPSSFSRVGAEQVDRALAAGRGQGHVPRGAPKVDAGVFDNRSALVADLDGVAAGITQVEVTARVLVVASDVVADANEVRATQGSSMTSK